MLRRTTLAFGVVGAIVLTATWAYRRIYVDQFPPTRGEFSVYKVLLARLASDQGHQPEQITLARRTLHLSAPQLVSWIPAELRQNKMRAPSEFVSFCGALCGHDFELRNATTWQLKPDAGAGIGASMLEAPQAARRPSKGRVIEVSRVGFDLWRNRAVLIYTGNCDELSRESPLMCMEFGEAYLRKNHGAWVVDHYQSFMF